MPCIPFNQVGTLWEASQEVGRASYIKLDFYVYIKTGFYLYCSKITPLKLEFFALNPPLPKGGKARFNFFSKILAIASVLEML